MTRTEPFTLIPDAFTDVVEVSGEGLSKKGEERAAVSVRVEEKV